MIGTVVITIQGRLAYHAALVVVVPASAVGAQKFMGQPLVLTTISLRWSGLCPSNQRHGIFARQNTAKDESVIKFPLGRMTVVAKAESQLAPVFVVDNLRDPRHAEWTHERRHLRDLCQRIGQCPEVA